jgi:D-glycero-D-manno-heptose 1,7-bisphosphate phosphatase
MNKAVFLDRDGVINYWTPELDTITLANLELNPDIDTALRWINARGYMVMVVTNQPGIAKGYITAADVEAVHNEIRDRLSKKCAYVLDFFYCPHHPEGGHAGEVPELKIDCDCRKPKPGMLLTAARRYNINLAESFLIGDKDTDIEAGNAAGLKGSFLIGTNESILTMVNLLL